MQTKYILTIEHDDTFDWQEVLDEIRAVFNEVEDKGISLTDIEQATRPQVG